ncbi:hypothetical protein [Deinococcus rufus]|uniref:Lipoprotein n=1 Tax=Deinococcus rufus TaxID=2136097 RepID=A0ABV7ZEW6_9DEIO
MRHSTTPTASPRPVAALRVTGMLAFTAALLLSGCSQQEVVAPTATAVSSADTGSAAPGTPATVPAAQPAGQPLALTSTVSAVTLTHWTPGDLPVKVTGGEGSGPVTLRVERTDGETGDVIEVTPATVTPGDAPTALKLRATRVAFPAPDGAAPWRLVASQEGREVAHLDLDITLNTVNLKFTVQPVTAREGQTAQAILTVDADSHDLPPFTFTLSPYIAEDEASIQPANRTYSVTTLPATVQVPITFGMFPGDPAGGSAAFQLSVDGLSDTLGSNRYLGKYVRADLTWNLAR